MSSTDKRRRRRESELPCGDSAGRFARRKSIVSHTRRAVQQEGSWSPEKRGALRFVLLLAVGVLGFNALFLLWISTSEFFEAYLHVNAEASGAVLELLGDEASVNGASIATPRFSLTIKSGCDAIQASAFFVFAVLASPVSVSRLARIRPVVVGSLLLMALNVVRIVGLYYTGVYSPEAFDMMHVEVGQAAFIFLPIFFWLMWVRSVSGRRTPQFDVSK